MNPVEFRGVSLGYWKTDIWTDKTWWEHGCGPRGEVGVSVGPMYNVSGKEIRTVIVYCVPCDATGDVVGKEKRCECVNIYLPGDGIRSFDFDEDDLDDIYEEEPQTFERLWCAPTADYAAVTKVQVIFADGSTEEIDGENTKSIYDDDSVYDKIVKEKEAAIERAEEEKRKAEAERRKAEEERRKAEAERRKSEEERRKAEEEQRKKEEKLARGIVASAGITDPSQCTVRKIGHVTFYLQNREQYLVGWESTRKLDCLELPKGCKYMADACIKNVTTLVCPRGTKLIDLSTQFTDFDGSGVKKIVIPKEVKCIKSEYRLGNVEEIEFEDPYGWGMKKNARMDSKEAYKYMCQYLYNCVHSTRNGLPSLETPKIKKSSVKAFFEKIF